MQNNLTYSSSTQANEPFCDKFISQDLMKVQHTFGEQTITQCSKSFSNCLQYLQETSMKKTKKQTIRNVFLKNREYFGTINQ